jgi:hypothetical protein
MEISQMTECIHLANRFDHQYRITFDKAYYLTNRPRETLGPWFMQIPCRYGTIYPHGGVMLVVEIDHHNRVANRVASLPGAELIQDGDDEKAIRFHVDSFDSVAKIVRPRRRRQISDAERARLAGLSRDHGFQTPPSGPVLGV